MGKIESYFRATRVVTGITSAILLSAATPVMASNGLRVLGPDPITLSMGGAGVARPQTSTAIYMNPAGMNDLGDQTDLSFTVGFTDHFMGTSLAPAGNPDAVNVNGTEDPTLLPNGSIVFGFLDNNRLSVGIGSIFSAGFQAEFPVSRFPSSVTSNVSDLSGRYANIKIIPAASYRILDNVSLGVGLDINYAMFNTDSAVIGPNLPETAGRSRNDSALGIGGRIGLIYKPFDILQIGAIYVTRQHFQKFDRYADLIDTGLDLPQEVGFGVSLRPFTGAELQTDFRWINWDSGFIGRSLGSQPLPGLEWRDQYVFAGGFQYNFDDRFEVPIVLRLGYNFGQSPITPTNVFQNVLIPAVIEHHLTAGASLDITSHFAVDAAYIHEFKNSVTDDGSGNPAGAGSFVGTSAEAFSVGIRGKWGKTKENET